MSDFYLDFETPIKDFDNEILELQSINDPDENIRKKITKLQTDREKQIHKIFSKINRWQKVQIARHPNRPYSQDYFNLWTDNFLELHGDRHYGDDPSIIAGIGTLQEQPVLFLGHQKGRNTN